MQLSPSRSPPADHEELPMTTTAPTPTTGTDPVSRFLTAVESGAGIPAGLFAPNVVVDATVPGWRFTTAGSAAVSQELGRWYADPGHFEEIVRTPIAGGELLEFVLIWVENGVPHAAHQVHRLEIDGDAIRGDRAWCGGRWPEALLAEMKAANMTASA
jgi:hypothetical protein